jgi:hypothetical protein
VSVYAQPVGGKRKRALPGRYDLREIGARIDKRRRQLGREVKDVIAEMRIQKWDWSRKVRADGSAFTIEECGFLADLFDAPPGWPFLSEEAGEMLRRIH